MDKCCVYELTFSNGKKYVGVTFDIKKRMTAHKRGNSLISKAYKKHGRPSIQILLFGARKYCYEMEERLIEQRQTLVPYGYNLMTGRTGNSRHSEETLVKISNALRGRKFTEEHKKKIGEQQIGRKVSTATRLKMSQSQSGKKLSKATREKISAAVTARWVRERQENG